MNSSFYHEFTANYAEFFAIIALAVMAAIAINKIAYAYGVKVVFEDRKNKTILVKTRKSAGYILGVIGGVAFAATMSRQCFNGIVQTLDNNGEHPLLSLIGAALAIIVMAFVTGYMHERAFAAGRRQRFVEIKNRSHRQGFKVLDARKGVYGEARTGSSGSCRRYFRA